LNKKGYFVQSYQHRQPSELSIRRTGDADEADAAGASRLNNNGYFVHVAQQVKPRPKGERILKYKCD